MLSGTLAYAEVAMLLDRAHNNDTAVSLYAVERARGDPMGRWVIGGLFLLLTGVIGAQVSGRAVSGSAGATTAGVTTANALKNAPFSAEVVTLYDRGLDNGGHIHRETHGKIFRDSQGRVRTDSGTPSAQSSTDKFDHVTINDPVQRVIINLNPKMKTATIFHVGQGVGPTAPIGMANVGGSPVNVAPAQQGLKPAERNAIPGTTTTSKMGAKLGTTPVETRTEALGSRTIEGVSATGSRTTRIIDAGMMGNEKPIVSVSETWFSPELKMTVLTKTDDGQSGHSTVKLVNITRTEPIAQLFQVPADYIVKDTEPATASVKH
jgi:hypothetical protein